MPRKPDESLRGRDKRIITEVLGKNRTYQDVGDEYGISRERVRQIITMGAAGRSELKKLAATRVNPRRVKLISKAIGSIRILVGLTRAVSFGALAEGCGVPPTSARHILANDTRYWGISEYNKPGDRKEGYAADKLIKGAVKHYETVLPKMQAEYKRLKKIADKL